MNKIKLFSLVLGLALLGANVKLSADSQSVYDGWSFTEVSASSGVIHRGPARVGKVWLSSTTNNGSPTDWAILVDSVALVDLNGTAIENVSNANVKSPPMVFMSTPVVSAGTLAPSFDALPYGVFFSSGITLWKTVGASGRAFRAYILWRP